MGSLVSIEDAVYQGVFKQRNHTGFPGKDGALCHNRVHTYRTISDVL